MFGEFDQVKNPDQTGVSETAPNLCFTNDAPAVLRILTDIDDLEGDALAERKIFESTVIMLPTRYRGATGSPVRVIALR